MIWILRTTRRFYCRIRRFWRVKALIWRMKLLRMLLASSFGQFLWLFLQRKHRFLLTGFLLAGCAYAPAGKRGAQTEIDLSDASDFHQYEIVDEQIEEEPTSGQKVDRETTRNWVEKYGCKDELPADALDLLCSDAEQFESKPIEGIAKMEGQLKSKIWRYRPGPESKFSESWNIFRASDPTKYPAINKTTTFADIYDSGPTGKTFGDMVLASFEPQLHETQFDFTHKLAWRKCEDGRVVGYLKKDDYQFCPLSSDSQVSIDPQNRTLSIGFRTETAVAQEELPFLLSTATFQEELITTKGVWYLEKYSGSLKTELDPSKLNMFQVAKPEKFDFSIQSPKEDKRPPDFITDFFDKGGEFATSEFSVDLGPLSEASRQAFFSSKTPTSGAVSNSNQTGSVFEETKKVLPEEENPQLEEFAEPENETPQGSLNQQADERASRVKPKTQIAASISPVGKARTVDTIIEETPVPSNIVSRKIKEATHKAKNESCDDPIQNVYQVANDYKPEKEPVYFDYSVEKKRDSFISQDKEVSIELARPLTLEEIKDICRNQSRHYVAAISSGLQMRDGYYDENSSYREQVQTRLKENLNDEELEHQILDRLDDLEEKPHDESIALVACLSDNQSPLAFVSRDDLNSGDKSAFAEPLANPSLPEGGYFQASDRSHLYMDEDDRLHLFGVFNYILSPKELLILLGKSDSWATAYAIALSILPEGTGGDLGAIKRKLEGNKVRVRLTLRMELEPRDSLDREQQLVPVEVHPWSEVTKSTIPVQAQFVGIFDAIELEGQINSEKMKTTSYASIFSF